MTHDDWSERLSEYLDGELRGAEAGDAEAHLARCDACRRALAELRAVRARARNLASRGPATDLWPAIAAAIGSEGPVRADVRPIRPRRRYAFSLPQLAAAGIALAALGGTGVWLAERGGSAVPLATTPAPSTALPAAGGDLVVPAATQTVTTTYDAAIGDLEAVLDAGRARLDPETVRVIEANLATIDSAIADARRAIASDPANAYLNTYLTRTMQRKLDLLRRAAVLATSRS
jgi:anti-sigma factor RsiW